MIYLKIDMTNAKINLAKKAMEKAFKFDRSANVLSVNVKRDGSVAWVKLVKDIDVTPFSGLVIDKATTHEEHQTKVLSDVDASDWYPEEEI